jgi:tetratricopeptide (TPR) repeat protein
VPDSIAAVIEGALVRDRDHRFATARAMREALEAALAEISVPCERSSLHAVSSMPKKTLSPDALVRGDDSGVRRIHASAKTMAVMPPAKPARLRRFGRGVFLVALALAGIGGIHAFASTEPESPSARPSTIEAAKAAPIETSATDDEPGTVVAPAPAEAPAPRVQRHASTNEHPARTAEERRARSLASRGRAALAAGRIEDAYRMYDEATDLDPDSAAAWRGFGLAAYQRGNMGEARRAMRRYRALTD